MLVAVTVMIDSAVVVGEIDGVSAPTLLTMIVIATVTKPRVEITSGVLITGKDDAVAF